MYVYVLLLALDGGSRVHVRKGWAEKELSRMRWDMSIPVSLYVPIENCDDGAEP